MVDIEGEEKREQSSVKHEKPIKEEESVKNKITDTIDNLKKNEKIEDLYNYAKSNTADTVAYVAMILGLLILFFEPFYGGTIIGIVTGLYFSKEIMKPVGNLENFIEEFGMVRSLILGGLLLAFFIKTPMIFISAAAVVAVKQLIAPDKNGCESNGNQNKKP
ncbi:MAG: hypothetical protein VX777_07105 [Chlamydiota bacterium]|nr:hypothetical protein [Chlamydiota bacterium]